LISTYKYGEMRKNTKDHTLHVMNDTHLARKITDTCRVVKSNVFNYTRCTWFL